MTKRLVTFFDGTWNRPDQRNPTNVIELYRAVLGEDLSNVDESPTERSPNTSTLKWYDAGVGTPWTERVRGGVFGLGLSRNIRQGYKFLVDQYEDGDEIYIFGFSRGAYSSRSLAGLIRNVGLVKKEHAPSEDADDNPVIEQGYELYRTRDDGPDADAAIAFRDQYTWGLVPIKFVGVWDTVGSLGIPFGVQGMINDDRYAFHDTRLSGIVEHSYHALAVDEYREDYEPTLWKGPKKDGQTMEQVWFVGAHSDVGGSSKRAFGEISLRWMMEKAQLGGDGLEFRLDLPETTDDYLTTRPSDSHGDMFRGLYAKFMRFLVMVRVRKDDHHLRPVEQLEHGEESVHHTVRAKIAQDTGYRPQNPGL